MDIKQFLEIEKKYDLYNKEVEGIHFWILCRFAIWNYKICTTALGMANSQSPESRNLKSNFRRLAIFLYNLALHSRPRKKHYDVCFIAHERRHKDGAFYKCIYTDELKENFANSITLEKPYNGTHLRPIKDKDIIYTDCIMFPGELYGHIHLKYEKKLFNEIHAKIKEILAAPVKEMLDFYKINLDENEIIEYVAKVTLIAAYEKKKYYRLIRKLSPKVIVEVAHYSVEGMLINEIARELGIKTIELQHGTMHSEHSAYQFGYNTLIPQLPNEIFTFSEYWNDIIHMPDKSTRLIATGFPYFEEQVKIYSAARHENDNKKYILFLSQGTIGRQLFELAVKLNGIIDKNRYEIIYKLHPAEYKDWRWRYGIDDSEAGFQVIDNSEVNLYELFAKSYVQVGVYSTAIYEGIGFGLKTFIYNIGHADTMMNLVNGGYADLVENENDLYKGINESSPVNEEKSLIFWKTNSKEAIIKHIEASINEQ